MLTKRYPNNLVYFDVYIHGERHRFNEPEEAIAMASKLGVNVFRCEDEVYYSPEDDNLRSVRFRVFNRLNRSSYVDATVEEAERLYNDYLNDNSIVKLEIWFNRNEDYAPEHPAWEAQVSRFPKYRR